MTRKLAGGVHAVRQHPEPHLKAACLQFGTLISESADAWVSDNATRLSASVAFYAVLSIVPFLMVVGAIAGEAFGQKAVEGQLFWELQDLVGPQGAAAIRGLITANHKSATVTVLGLVTLAFGTSAVVMELRDALNKIWHVKGDDTDFGVRGFLKLARERFYLFGLILGAGIILLASLALNAVLVAASAEFGAFLPLSPTLLHVVVFIGSFFVITLLFAAIYKLVPDIRLHWNDVVVGACFTSLLFTIGKQLIGVYLGKASVGSAYGAAGSFIIVLMWVYYSTQLFFFGAEFTRAYARRVHPRKEIGVAPAAPIQKNQ
jgi:membrane protein